MYICFILYHIQTENIFSTVCILSFHSDNSIPNLVSVMSNRTEQLDKLQSCIRDQSDFEQFNESTVKLHEEERAYPDIETECKQPQ